MATKFETKPCGRCGGGGRYSYCQMYGDTCFDCRGTGAVLTKRGIAAKAYMRELRTVKVTELQIGWLLWEDGMFTKPGWKVITELNPQGSARYMKDGEWHNYFDISTANGGGMGTFPNSTVQAVANKERLEETLVMALAYQETLRQDGKPSKKTRELVAC